MLIQKMSKELLDEMYQEHYALMDKIENILWDEGQKDKHSQYYNSSTHDFLRTHAWEIIFPVSQEEWFKNLQNLNWYNKAMPWPQYAPYQYSMDVLLPPNMAVSSLYFGYAVLEDDTVQKTCFFNWHKIVDYQVMPQGIAMDPLAKLHNIPVKYYVGIPVEEIDLQNFISRIPGHPLENYVNRKSEEEHQERLYDMYMESYALQMAHEPQYFPRKLIEFANENGLYVPEGQKSKN